MKLRIMSDLHLEFSKYKIHLMDGEAEQTLVLAGDICSLNTTANVGILRDFLDDACARFHEVVYVKGNHEAYGTTIYKASKLLEHLSTEYSNLHVLDNDTYRQFIGTTLWTNLNRKDPLSKIKAYLGMNDYTAIRGFSIEDGLSLHYEAVKFIENKMSKESVVVTHHLPSYRSIPAKYEGSALNCAYASDLDDIIMAWQPRLWIHGHTHDSCDYVIGNTRVICNPRGYNDENFDFNPYLVVEIDD